MKVSVTLHQSEIDRLRKSAKNRGLTMTEALRRCINLMRFVDENHERGSNFLVEHPDGSVFYMKLR